MKIVVQKFGGTSVSTNESEVENATSGISNVSTFATTFLIITLVIGAIVLFLIIFIFG